MPEPASADAVRAFGAQRNYSTASIERWLRLTPGDGAALLELARELRLGENQLRDLWEWAEEIAARDGSALAEVFASETLAAARRRPVGRNDKLKLVKAALRRLRFPQLAAVEDRLSALVRELALPHNVRLALPEFLEGDALRVEIVADSPAALRAAAGRLHDAAQTHACALIFELLAEAP